MQNTTAAWVKMLGLNNKRAYAQDPQIERFLQDNPMFSESASFRPPVLSPEEMAAMDAESEGYQRQLAAEHGQYEGLPPVQYAPSTFREPMPVSYQAPAAARNLSNTALPQAPYFNPAGAGIAEPSMAPDLASTGVGMQPMDDGSPADYGGATNFTPKPTIFDRLGSLFGGNPQPSAPTFAPPAPTAPSSPVAPAPFQRRNRFIPVEQEQQFHQALGNDSMMVDSYGNVLPQYRDDAALVARVNAAAQQTIDRPAAAPQPQMPQLASNTPTGGIPDSLNVPPLTAPSPNDTSAQGMMYRNNQAQAERTGFINSGNDGDAADYQQQVDAKNKAFWNNMGEAGQTMDYMRGNNMEINQDWNRMNSATKKYLADSVNNGRSAHILSRHPEMADNIQRAHRQFYPQQQSTAVPGSYGTLPSPGKATVFSQRPTYFSSLGETDGGPKNFAPGSPYAQAPSAPKPAALPTPYKGPARVSKPRFGGPRRF